MSRLVFGVVSSGRPAVPRVVDARLEFFREVLEALSGMGVPGARPGRRADLRGIGPAGSSGRPSSLGAAGQLRVLTCAAFSAVPKVCTSLISPGKKSATLPLYLSRPIVSGPVAFHRVMPVALPARVPFTYR